MFGIVPFSGRHNDLMNMDSFWDSFMDGRTVMPSSILTDVTDDGTSYQLEAELPGFDKKDINIDIQDDCLTISAKHEETKEDSDKEKNYIRQERYYGSFSRSFDVSDVDVDGITASYVDGILKLSMPKKAEAQSTSKQITVE